MSVLPSVGLWERACLGTGAVCNTLCYKGFMIFSANGATWATGPLSKPDIRQSCRKFHGHLPSPICRTATIQAIPVAPHSWALSVCRADAK
eukprot:gene53577-71601_t